MIHDRTRGLSLENCYSVTIAGIKKVLMLCIKAFPCRHFEEKVEGLTTPHRNPD